MNFFNQLKEEYSKNRTKNNIINDEKKQKKKSKTKLFDFLKVNDFKNEITNLEIQIEDIKKEFSDIEKLTALELKQDILEKEQKIDSLKIEENNLINEIQEKSKRIKHLDSQLISTSEEIEMESFSLYQPKYDFATALGYKDKLTDIRKKQKEMIKTMQDNEITIVVGPAGVGKGYCALS